MKNYRAQTPQNLAFTKILKKIQENEHIPAASQKKVCVINNLLENTLLPLELIVQLNF